MGGSYVMREQSRGVGAIAAMDLGRMMTSDETGYDTPPIISRPILDTIITQPSEPVPNPWDDPPHVDVPPPPRETAPWEPPPPPPVMVPVIKPGDGPGGPPREGPDYDRYQTPPIMILPAPVSLPDSIPGTLGPVPGASSPEIPWGWIAAGVAAFLFFGRSR